MGGSRSTTRRVRLPSKTPRLLHQWTTYRPRGSLASHVRNASPHPTPTCPKRCIYSRGNALASIVVRARNQCDSCIFPAKARVESRLSSLWARSASSVCGASGTSLRAPASGCRSLTVSGLMGDETRLGSRVCGMQASISGVDVSGLHFIMERQTRRWSLHAHRPVNRLSE